MRGQFANAKMLAEGRRERQKWFAGESDKGWMAE
jgi:hypothetical protein